MKGQITYIKGHKKSEEQAKYALASFKKNANWDITLNEGLTPATVKDVPEFQYKIIKNSRLHDFKEENYNTFAAKMACAINHIYFWRKVVEADEPMAFLEHDAVCIGGWYDYKFEDYLLLNAETVFRRPNKLGLGQFKNYNFNGIGVCDFPKKYPLTYHKHNEWWDANMAPGTGAYAISPSGAKKMLAAVEKYGIDQSDFMINSFNVRMQYITPSLAKFNKVNLSTSYGT
jgi:GR25 family glycosyltransferase involved in LPS biosynthesis